MFRSRRLQPLKQKFQAPIEHGLRWLLLLAVWQGPLPWLHAHGTLGDFDFPGNLWLVQHLQQHHPAMETEVGGCLGWHVHIFYPCSSPEEREHSLAPVCEQFLAGNTGSHLTTALIRALWDQSDILQQTAFQKFQTLSLFCRTPGLSPCFYERYAVELAMPMRFCVVRC